MEAEKCEVWCWKSWKEIRQMAQRDGGVQELFLPMENFVLQGWEEKLVLPTTVYDPNSDL